MNYNNPRTALAEAYGPIHADGIIETLRRAGYIIVVKDAIRLAQMAVANDNERPVPAVEEQYLPYPGADFF